MKVSELIAELGKQDADAEVEVTEANTGDSWPVDSVDEDDGTVMVLYDTQQ